MAYNIMIQGTMSGVGKSFLCAALCRIFHEDGYRCAPFKSQNMALNSCVTKEGLEMGRAQVMQAEAACIEPDVRMNPILLKPSSDVGSQVIVNGKSIGHYDAREYFAYRKELVPQIMSAYQSLAQEYDIIVIEGAGSCAEINLKKDDIVNMGLARMTDAPVLLVGDIDPGGVFAQLYGTAALLEEEERRRIRGLVINKFRGDKSLLDPGIRMLEEKTGIPVLGVIPYSRAELDEEDSMASGLKVRSHDRPADIAVIRFPRISNFTDFTPLTHHGMMGVRYVTRAQQFGDPDVVILPGTKSTRADLEWLKISGIGDCILTAAKKGSFVIGICGGYQMLGEQILDPGGVEGVPGESSVPGLGLLPVRTVFGPEKILRQVNTTIEDGFLAGARVSGYEIHMGDAFRTDRPGSHAGPAERPGQDGSGDRGLKGSHAGPEERSGQPEDQKGRGEQSALTCAKGNVFGTFLHGLFDSGEAVDALARVIPEKAGCDLSGEKAQDMKHFRELQYRMAAKELRSHLNMQQIYRVLRREDAPG